MAASDLWTNFGHYGATGITGAEALAYELNRIVYTSGIKSPVTTDRGLQARLRYLDSKAGRAELRAQGISPARVRAWRQGKARPSAANREKLDNAYWTRRRDNVLRSGYLKRLLNNEGRGRLIEITPADQTGVIPPRRRPNVASTRSVTVRYVWDDAVDAWAAQDIQTLDEIWDDIICDLDTDYRAYAYVTSIGIAA